MITAAGLALRHHARELLLVRRERQVIGVAGVSTARASGKACQINIEDVSDQVRNDGRAWATLRERFFIASDLRQNGRHLWLQREVLVLQEESTHPPEVDRSKEVFEVEIEDKSFVAMSSCVRDDRALAFETMRNPIRMLVVIASLVRLVDLVNAVLKHVGKPSLQKLEFVHRRGDLPNASRSLWNVESLVLGRFRPDVQKIGHSRWFEAKDGRDLVQRACGFQRCQLRHSEVNEGGPSGTLSRDAETP